MAYHGPSRATHRRTSSCDGFICSVAGEHKLNVEGWSARPRVPELQKQGLRIHVADPQSLWDGDQFTAKITYLAAILDFLNEATDGSDFDIGPFLFEQLELITVKPEVVPEPSFAASDESEWVRFSSAPQRVTLSVVPEKVVKIECESFDSHASIRNQTRTPSGLLSNRGKPTVVIASVYSREPLKARLVQSLGPDATDSIVESTDGIFLMPAGFDAAKPFHIDFEFQSTAEVQVSRLIRIGLPAR